MKGAVFVVRGIKSFRAKLGTWLFVGDKVNVEKGSRAKIMLFGSGLIMITEDTSFQIPSTKPGTERPVLVPKIIWNKVKKLVNGESFDIDTPTAVCGVRG